jgi:hypothetical protein
MTNYHMPKGCDQDPLVDRKVQEKQLAGPVYLKLRIAGSPNSKRSTRSNGATTETTRNLVVGYLDQEEWSVRFLPQIADTTSKKILGLEGRNAAIVFPPWSLLKLTLYRRQGNTPCLTEEKGGAHSDLFYISILLVRRSSCS